MNNKRLYLELKYVLMAVIMGIVDFLFQVFWEKSIDLLRTVVYILAVFITLTILSLISPKLRKLLGYKDV